MTPPLSQTIQRGLDRVFEQAGQQATWLVYSGISGGSPEYGLGPTEIYSTAVASVVQMAWAPAEVQVAGGQFAEGEFPALTRDRIGKDDQLFLGSAYYRVNGDPVTAFIQGVQFYRLRFRRA